jgi:hypothetical protein
MLSLCSAFLGNYLPKGDDEYSIDTVNNELSLVDRLVGNKSSIFQKIFTLFSPSLITDPSIKYIFIFVDRNDPSLVTRTSHNIYPLSQHKPPFRDNPYSSFPEEYKSIQTSYRQDYLNLSEYEGTSIIE